MQRAKICFELRRGDRVARQALLRAALKRGCKPLAGNSPAAGLRLGVETLDQRGLALDQPGESHRPIVTAAGWHVFRHLRSEGARTHKPEPNSEVHSCILGHMPSRRKCARKTRATPARIAVG